MTRVNQPLPPIALRDLVPADRPWVRRLLTEHWGSSRVVTRGCVHEADCLPGVCASLGGLAVGLATYRVAGSECELVTMNSVKEGLGVGTALLDAVLERARIAGCARLWLITTNDNLHALGFYQRRGLRVVAVHRDAMETSRSLKPEIPLVGSNGIAIRDEIELELALGVGRP